MTRPIGIRVDWNVDAASWTDTLAQCPGATFFHTQGWLEAVRASLGVSIARVRFTLPTGGTALLPLSIHPLARGLVPVALAGETGAYSGLVSPDPLSEAEAAACYAAVLSRFPNLHVTGNPFARGAHLPGPACGGKQALLSTHLLKLRPFEALRQGFSRGCKARGNKARRQGLEVIHTCEHDGVEAFYRLYLDSVRRWGDKLTWARSSAFFEALVEHGAPDVRLFLAMDEGRAVSGLVMAAWGDTAHYVAGATAADALAGCPSNLLMEAALAHYEQDGRSYFDFGPSNGLAGVIQFKESFGARSVPFLSQRHASVPGSLYFTLRHARDRAAQAMHAATAGARQTAAASP